MLIKQRPIKTKNDLMTVLRTADVSELLVIDNVTDSRVAASKCARFLNDRSDTTLILLRTKK